ncbi:hypothetical protein HGI15_00115 [Modestobacter lapidis]|nr:hypothetical protein [Modestobacter lapidis]
MSHRRACSIPVGSAPASAVRPAGAAEARFPTCAARTTTTGHCTETDYDEGGSLRLADQHRRRVTGHQQGAYRHVGEPDHGELLLARLSALHRDELRRMDDVLTLPRWHAQAWHGLSTSTAGEQRHDYAADESPPADGAR